MAERRGYFRFPVIDETLCNGCGLCLRKCPAENVNPRTVMTTDGFPHIFVAYAGDEGIRRASSSGGIFTLFANRILDGGGVVCGAAFTKGCRLEHIIVEGREGLAPLRGSKYLQSDTGLVFKRIKEMLAAGRKVLFSGTPCQVAAMKLVAGKNQDNLYTVDFFCHGVPPQKLFEEYVNVVTDGNADTASNISFRLKTSEGGGWKDFHISIEFESEGKRRRYEGYKRKDPYFNGFASNLFLRKSCGNCRFSHIPREGDFSIADAWVLAERDFNIKDNKGASIVCVNNPKAKAFFAGLREDLGFIAPTTIDAVHQANYIRFHSYLHPNSARFMEWLEKPHDKKDLPSKINEYLNKDDNVAILNYHESRDNYGSVIAGYALQEKIKGIIGYSPLHILVYDGFNGEISDLRDFTKEHILETAPCPSEGQLRGLNRHFRTFIVGPDTVWRNAGFFPRFHSFLLDFAFFSKNICSYAPSFLRPILLDRDPKTMKESPVGERELVERKRLMKRFSHISVREDSGVRICKESFDVDAEHVLDAVFLLRASDYEKIIAESELPARSGFVAYYLLADRIDGELKAFLEKNVDAVSLRPGLSQDELFRGGDASKLHGPRMCEWLQAIHDCDFLLTDSFHGLCFALIFRKQFGVVKRAEYTGEERIQSLLRMFGISFDRYVNSLADYERVRNNPLDYGVLGPRIEEWVAKSETYLRKVLDDNKPNEVRNWLESIEIGQMQMRNATEPKGAPHCVARILSGNIKRGTRGVFRRAWRFAKFMRMASVENVGSVKTYRIMGVKIFSR